jgi:hypothetical protein
MRGKVFLGKLLLVALVGMLALAWPATTVAKPACTPIIKAPDNGALAVSVTPEIVIDPNRRKKCHIKKTELSIETVDGQNRVLKKTIDHKRGIGASGPLPTLTVQVDPGVLERNTHYRLEVVQYPPKHIGTFHEDIGTHLDRAAFVTEGGDRQTLVISSRYRDGATNYTLEGRKGARFLTGRVDGKAVSRQPNDKDLGNCVTGRVSGGADAIYLRGAITRFDLSHPTAASVFVNGAWTDVVVIDGTAGESGRTSYDVETNGSIAHFVGTIGAHKVTEQSRDVVRGQRARGYVSAGNDGLLVSGQLRTLALQAPERAALFVNGRPAHTVVIDGSEGSGQTDYRFQAGHRVEKIAARVNSRDVSIQSNDRIKDHRRVEGTVVNGADGYLVIGDIYHSDVTLADPTAARVYIDGAPPKVDFDRQRPDTGTDPDFDRTDQSVDPDELPFDANTLVIDGTAAPNETTTYRFRSNKPIQKADGRIGRFTVTADQGDKVNGNTVDGGVGNGLDGYRLRSVI